MCVFNLGVGQVPMHHPQRKGGPQPVCLTTRHRAFLTALCLRRRLSINSCRPWVREGEALFLLSAAGPAPHWLPTWRKEGCLGTLPSFKKQTLLFIMLTCFSSTYFPSAALSLVLLLFLQWKSISCLSVTKEDIVPPPCSVVQRKSAYFADTVLYHATEMRGSR